jgi:hypothetical protein
VVDRRPRQHPPNSRRPVTPVPTYLILVVVVE